MIVVETVRQPPRLPVLGPSFHREGRLWWPDYETPHGHVLVHWLISELWRTEPVTLDQGGWSLGALREWFELAREHGVHTMFGVSVDTGTGT